MKRHSEQGGTTLVRERGPFMNPQNQGRFYHYGRFLTLLEVVKSYNDRFNLALSGQEENDLVEYLKSQWTFHSIHAEPRVCETRKLSLVQGALARSSKLILLDHVEKQHWCLNGICCRGTLIPNSPRTHATPHSRIPFVNTAFG